MPNDKPKGFRRNLTNYGDRDFALYLRRSFARSMGYSLDMLDRPIVGIAQTASGFNNCHRYVPELVEAVKRGVIKAGGLPLEFPTISLGEIFLSPTSLVYRNLMSMDTEEMIRAQPMDACVLVGGCDKTVPAQLMGAASADLPAIQLVTGPMMAMPYRGERLGACTDCRRFWAKYRAAEIDAQQIAEVEGNLATTAGTCAVMGTASTMAWRCPILPPSPLSTLIACAQRRPQASAPFHWRQKTCDRAASLRPIQYRTPCEFFWPSAARPTPSSTSLPSLGGAAFRYRWRSSIDCRTTHPYWSISNLPVSTTCRTCTPQAACKRF